MIVILEQTRHSATHASFPPTRSRALPSHRRTRRLSRSLAGRELLARAQRPRCFRRALVSTVRQRTPHAMVPAALAASTSSPSRAPRSSRWCEGCFPRTSRSRCWRARSLGRLPDAGHHRQVLLETTLWLSYGLGSGQPLPRELSAPSRSSEDAPSHRWAERGDDLLRLVGLLQRVEDPFDDFVVHEAAHIFHNCKRRTVGLAQTPPARVAARHRVPKARDVRVRLRGLQPRPRAWQQPAARRLLLPEIEEGPVPPDDRVDPVEYIDILREAIAARNGWKRILRRCSPAKVPRYREVGTK